MTQKAVIIGAGLGGLAASIRLQSAGFQVTLIEKNSHCGGKMQRMQVGSASFDYGPNTITMPHIFQQVLTDAGLDPDDYFSFRHLENHTTNQFKDGSSFTFSSNKEQMKTELEKIDWSAADQYENYLTEVGKLYEQSAAQFFKRTFHHPKTYMSPSLFKAFTKVRPFETMDHFHRRFFRDERITAAFNRYATYIGSSPYTAPATFGLIGHLELSQGVYYTEGGNPSIAEGLTRAARTLGVSIHTEEAVRSLVIKDKKVTAAVTDHQVYEADVLILNGDLMTQVPALLPPSARPSMPDTFFNKAEPSLSAWVLLADIDESLPLNHHHVFFGENPKEEFDAIFRRRQFAEDPIIYLCTSAKTEPERRPGGENTFILVNAPARTGAEQPFSKDRLWEKLRERGLPLTKPPAAEKILDPGFVEQQYNAYRGALYGLSSHSKKSSFLRPGNKSRDLSNFYYCGGSTHPGGGSPMVTMSGMNTADLVIKEYSLS
ncbi:phytoene desaturase family protein [Alkalicoccus urumqiensis]|uniref:4,4'-diaponeurosporene oxygenase n=1 Tax=Alkalicoccus urumqiensis TaxID=1548213 RepID=A0A2P6MKF7_ALKUR|nr:phytoene desaturase family protein [Alkalicoccus urumqiensis]PRO66753.1 phytoene desaturase [Alkalicoccus urumqiensis]